MARVSSNPSQILQPWSEDDELKLLAAVLEIAKEPAESYEPGINLFGRIGKIINKSFSNKEVLSKINDLKTRCEEQCRDVQNQESVSKTPVFEMGVQIWGDAMMIYDVNGKLLPQSTANAHDIEDHEEFQAEIHQTTKTKSTASVMDTVAFKASRPELKRAREAINEDGDQRSKNEDESGKPFGNKKKIRKRTCFTGGNSGHFAHNCPEEKKVAHKPIGNKKKIRKGTCFTCGNSGHFARDCHVKNKIVNILTKQQEHEEIPKDTYGLQYESKNKPDEQPSAQVSASAANANVHDNEDHQELQAENQQTAKPKFKASVIDTVSCKASRPELKRACEAIMEVNTFTKQQEHEEIPKDTFGLQYKSKNKPDEQPSAHVSASTANVDIEDHQELQEERQQTAKPKFTASVMNTVSCKASRPELKRACEEIMEVNTFTKQQEHEEIPKDTFGLQYESKNKPDEQPSAPVSTSTTNVDIEDHQELPAENQQAANPKFTASVMDTISCKASRPELKQACEAIMKEGDKRSKNEDESGNPLGKNKKIMNRTCLVCGKSGHFIHDCPEKKKIVNILSKQQEHEEIPKDTVSLQFESKNKPDEQPNAHVSASTANVRDIEEHQELQAEIQQNARPKSTASVMDTISVKASRPELKRAHEAINEEDDQRSKKEDKRGKSIGMREKRRKGTCFTCGNHGHFVRDCPEEKKIANILTKQHQHGDVPKDTIGLQNESKNKPDEQPSAPVSACSGIGSHQLESLETKQRKEACNNTNSASHQLNSHHPNQRESAYYNTKTGSHQVSSEKREADVSNSQRTHHPPSKKKKGSHGFEAGSHRLDPPWRILPPLLPPPYPWGPPIPMVMPYPPYRYPPPPRSYRYPPPAYPTPNHPVNAFNPSPTGSPAWFSPRHHR